MSGRQNNPNTMISDGSQKLTEEDKCGLYESSRTDSGFLSGGNLIVSGEITSEEQDSGLAPKESHTEEPYMHIDSGVDVLSQTFSSLSLKHPDLNDLSCKELKEEPKPRVAVEEQPWEIYYGQDEDGDT